ncbi:MAG: hypothetical protein HY782_07130 [Chloroflexi bacterium]|nr:hypothetical protein [Chloroflexota bacterium]
MTKLKVMLVAAALAALLSFAAIRAQAQTGTPAPGVYVADLKLNPDPPRAGNIFTFTPSFQNTANEPLNFVWRVLIYRADTPNRSYTDTTWTSTSFPTGSSDQRSLGDWDLPSGTACDWYFARVVFRDADNNQVPFTTTDGKVFEKGFTTCPPLDTTAATAPGVSPTPAPTTPPVASPSGPGLFVSDLKLNPDPPRVGNTFTFRPTFQNTTNNLFTITWRVLIYRAEQPNKSYTDTSLVTTGFPTGTTELVTPGGWVVPPGTPCDWYFARVVWQDVNNNLIPFTTPDGKVYEKGFTTCP